MKEHIQILLIEDDQDDVDLFQYALKANQVGCTVTVLMQGDEVGPYLRTAVDPPDIIVMDLNLPIVHGRDVLRQIRSAMAFEHVPLVVLTTSSAQEDQAYCLANGADGYLTKPTSISAYNATIQTVLGLVNRNLESFKAP